LPGDVLSIEGLERIARMPNIVVVEFGLLNQNEPVARIELIGFTLSKCANANGTASGACLRKHFSQDSSSYTFTLVRGLNVQVI